MLLQLLPLLHLLFLIQFLALKLARRLILNINHCISEFIKSFPPLSTGPPGLRAHFEAFTIFNVDGTVAVIEGVDPPFRVVLSSLW